MRLFRSPGRASTGRRAGHRERSYTLVIVPSEHSRVRRLVVQARALRLAAAAAGTAALVVALLGISFLRSRGQSAQIERLRAEAAAHRARTDRMARDLVEVENGMARLRAYESRLRTAFDHEGGGSGGESIPGIGGGEASLADLLDGPAGWQTDLAARVESDLGQVRGRLQAQEHGLSELVGFLEERRSLLASTPSLMPARGWVTSGYQRRSDPFTQNEVWHRGVDISAALGTPVMAPADGVVTVVGRESDFGNVLALDHGYGYLTRYAHTSRVLVRPGQRVRRGQVVALVGNTGRSTGPHLHYEVLRHGVPVDPQDYMIN